jgi:hypothetical protein
MVVRTPARPIDACVLILVAGAGCALSHSPPEERPDGGPTPDVSCTGDGLVHTIADPCMSDSGSTAIDDALEIYCCGGVVRLCLSREDCPWRDACVVETASCSTAGLVSELMAEAHCDLFEGNTQYWCAGGVAQLNP